MQVRGVEEGVGSAPSTQGLHLLLYGLQKDVSILFFMGKPYSSIGSSCIVSNIYD